MSEQRFRKEERLRRRREFLAVQRGGVKIHLDLLLAFVRPSSGRRLGLTVSKKVGKAFGRNRVKRLLREIWRRNKGLFPQRHDLVIVARRGAAVASYEELRDQLLRLARRLERRLRGAGG